MSVQDYSTTPSSNTTIAGINVGEGCAPANINNAIRQLMADLAVWAGDMVVGEDVQAYSAKLKALADLTWAANKLIYATGAGSLATSDLSAFARSLLDDADAATSRATLGLKALATKDKAAAGDIDVTGTPEADTVLFGDRWANPYPAGRVQAWANFDGTTSPITVRGSANVSSITDNGAGDYTINFATAMPNDDYAVLVTSKGQDNTTISSSNNPRPSAYSSALTTSVRVYTPTLSATLVDAALISVAIIG